MRHVPAISGLPGSRQDPSLPAPPTSKHAANGNSGLHRLPRQPVRSGRIGSGRIRKRPGGLAAAEMGGPSVTPSFCVTTRDIGSGLG